MRAEKEKAMLKNLKIVNPEMKYIDEWTEVADGLYLNRYGIITTGFVCYKLYCKSEHPTREYTSVMYNTPYGPVGEVVSLIIPEIESMPYGEERYQKYMAIKRALEAVEKTVAMKMYPNDFDD